MIFRKYRRALFLDRDGVINVDHGYVHHPEDVVYIDGAIELINRANSLGYLTVVITNQAGIGRGYYSESQFLEFMSWLCRDLEKRGARVDKYYFSPCHPTEGVGLYRREDYMRKPNPGMFLAARRELDIDMSNSIMVGDKISDVQASCAAGVGTNLLLDADCFGEGAVFPYRRIAGLAEAVAVLGR